MIKRRQRLGLALEALQPCRVRSQFRGQRLDGDLPIQARVVGQIHHAHATTPELSGNGVWSNLVRYVWHDVIDLECD
jgi:hypothetical protein